MIPMLCSYSVCHIAILTTLAHSRMECIMFGEKEKFEHADVSGGVKQGAEAINSKVYKETMIGGVDGQRYGFTMRAQILVLLTLSLQNTVETSRSSLHQNCNQIHTHTRSYTERMLPSPRTWLDLSICLIC